MLSVVITTKDRKDLLNQTIDEIFKSSNNNSIGEIIIVNDGSDDLNHLKNYSRIIKIIKNKGKGLASGRNTGAQISTFPILLFYDDDILPSKNHFERHLEIQTKYPNSIVTANRFYPDSIIFEAKKTSFGRYKLKYEYNWIDGCEPKDLDRQDGIYTANSLAGFSCCMPKFIWQSLNGYNETFPHAGCEDNEFFVRAKEKGYHLIFDENNHCWHNEMDNFTLKNWISRQARGIKGAIIIATIHPDGKKHPTYYLNTPIKANDSSRVKKIKRKRTFLSNKSIILLMYFIIDVLEFIKVPDSLLFRLYNAVWLGETKRSFMEEYKL